VKNNSSIGKVDSEDEDTEASSLNKSNIDDYYSDIVVPSHLIDEAADLSQLKYMSSQLTFEEIFTLEQTCSRRKRRRTEPDDTSNCLEDDTTLMSGTLPSSLLLLPFELKQNQWLNPSPDEAPEQDLKAAV